MKTTRVILTFILSMLAITGIQAQDIITKKDGNEIRAKVTEVGSNEVKYKIYGNDTSPIYTISKTDIFMIKYENGDKDMFNEKESENISTVKTSPVPVQNNTTNQIPAQSGDANQQKASTPETPSDPVNRKGYVGITIGGAFLSEEYSNISSGGQFTINFGYLFRKNVGISASIFGTSYSLDNYKDASIGLVGILAGPLFSIELMPQTIEIDARPTIGLGWMAASYNGESETSDETSFILGIGSSIRWNCSKRVSISANLDYYNGTIEKIDLSSFGISAGVNIRF